MGYTASCEQDGIHHDLGYCDWNDRVSIPPIPFIALSLRRWDFVIGLLFGIILACVFFVVQSSRRRAIRTVFNGSTAKSTVRRPRSQRAFIQQVGAQTYVMKLQGFRK